MTKASNLATKKKSEIIEIYQDLLARVEQQKQPPTPEKQRDETEKETAIATATSLSVDQIVHSCADLKLQLSKTLDALESHLTDEHRKFIDVQKAIEAETSRLEEIHQITAAADSLAALLAAQREQKESFEADMAKQEQELEETISQKRASWARERETFSQKQREEEEAIQKARDREEEEYQYKLQLTRKRDEDAYQAKQTALESELLSKRQSAEKELAERETFVESQEEELRKLKEEAASFPQKLQTAVEEAKTATAEQLQKEHQHQTELAQKESEGEKKLLHQTISTLQAKIAEQEKLIDQLTKKSDHSAHQVQEIAVRAIDGARPLRALNEQLTEIANAQRSERS